MFKAFRGKRVFQFAHHTELVALSRALFEMEMSVGFGVIKAGRNRADTVVELSANVAM